MADKLVSTDSGRRSLGAVNSTINSSGAPVVPAQVPGLQGLLGLAVGVVVIAGLYFAKDVLVPITLAVLLSFVLSPIVSGLRAVRVPKVLSCTEK